MGYKTYEVQTFNFIMPILFLIQSGAVISDFMQIHIIILWIVKFQIHIIKIVKFQKNKFNRLWL